jgi:hypothetical protein
MVYYHIHLVFGPDQKEGSLTTDSKGVLSSVEITHNFQGAKQIDYAK